jgi:glycosyltransferase involved in cell wall biosynthesis
METGYRARFGVIDDLAEGLRTLLADDELLSRLGRRCREVAEQEFSVAVQVERYAHLYEELVDAA